MGEYSMLDLFRQEVETQVESLKQSLAILQQQPNLAREQDAAVRSLHQIVGSAQIVEIEAAANLAAQMKASLLAVQSHQGYLAQKQIAPLLEACNLLLEISHASEGELEQWLSEHTEDLLRTQTAISDSPHQEIAPPHPPISATQPEKPDLVSSADNSHRDSLSSPVVGDTSMLELFRLEVEAQATILNNSLIALETQPQSAQELEALMRSAHSIKGAARIVGLDAAVHLAHAMEDCFVAAQNQMTLSPDRIDVLFRGVDLLQSLSQVRATQLQQWLADNSSDIELIQSTIAAMRSSEPATVALPRSPKHRESVVQNDLSDSTIETIPSKEYTSQVASESTSAQDRVVRVSAENLNRIMGLAGESMIESNWLQPFADSLILLKSRQRALSKSLETLQQDVLANRLINDSALLETARSQEQECREMLSDRMAELEGFIRRTDNLSTRLYREVVTSHMRPFADGVQGFKRMIRDLARTLNKQVKLDIVGESTAVDRDILKKLEAPLTHILRNAVDHGLELPEERIAAGKPAEGTVRLEAFHRGGMLAITIADDGKGIEPKILRQKIVDKNLATPEVAAQMTDAELMEFLFLPGFSMAKQVTELSGRGVGLDIAKSMAQEVGGTVRATSILGKGTSFYFQLPLTLSVVRTLLVEISGEAYAFPLSRIDQIVTVEKSCIAVVENRQYFTLNEKNIGLIPVHQVLNLPPPSVSVDPLWALVISDQANSYGLVVDRCLGERELVVRPLDPRLGKVQDISATALMGDGSLVLIVDVSDLVRSTNTLLNAGRLAKVSDNQGLTKQASLEIASGSFGIVQSVNRKRVLVVDDSITVREVERKLLQNRGYSVDVAVDGMEGWNALRKLPYDLVISDIDMPRMNGIELLRQIKSHPRLNSIPVIVVSYRDREEDRIQGLDAGADYYLTKNSFHDDSLIQAVIDLIGH